MKNLLILLIIFQGAFSFAQETPFCATDEMHQQLFVERPDLNLGIVRAYERLKQDTEDFLAQPRSTRSDASYIIPVVFHIIHNGGPENIEDSQILDAIQQVNVQLRKLNTDTSEIVQQFKTIAADTEIEIRLAQLDPEGNCTSGITRTVSSLTSIGDHQVKSLIQWPPDKYLNIYVCNQAAGLAGHALLPSAADTIPAWDGIVMQHSYVGTIGTSEYFRRTVLTHEIGHYLNLQHIWGGNNVPNYYYLPVANSGNCAFDDEVDDTPLTIGWQSCNTGGTSCMSLDNVQNYMDYAYCARMFTEGQRDRMQACLNSSVANRNNLWTPGNLAATGTDGLTNYLCQARFEANKRIACVGESITLRDVSSHGITSRNWNVPSGQLSSTTDSIVQLTFDQPGVYSVYLSVSNGSENLEAEAMNFIRVLPLTGTESALLQNFEDSDQFETEWAVVPKSDSVNWWINKDVGYQSEQSISVRNYFGQTTGIYEFISEPLDVSGLSSLLLTFDLAYMKKDGAGNELLQVLVSTNCGETWVARKSLYASATLPTVEEITDVSFIPESTAMWRNESVTNINSTYLTNNLMIKFRFEAKGGNNIYIDNIRIAHPDVIGLGEQELSEVVIYPNPFDQRIDIDLGTIVKAEKMELVDLSGKCIQLTIFDQQSNTIRLNTAAVNQGVYFLRIYTNAGEKVVKLVK